MENDELIFSRPLMLAPREDGGKWTLAEDWTLVYRGETYALPKGFETDGASVPRFLWRLCGTPLDVPRLYAALVHDYVYGGGDPEATRKDADDLYRDLQLALGVKPAKAWTEWAALRAFGASRWHAK